ASIGKTEFLKPVPTGSVLTLAVKMGKVRANMGVVTTTASIGEELVCHAELHFVVEANA
ncbi:3-hydroxyacyl-[acyl-carrier-protein] dehydratase FabZ, partial [Paenibacillus polymyxa]|nr:3-hydroxyacyl-[acyl-carrier-protein] dehydratase FabZ [Paenibacillus polymyxa]